MAKIKEINDEKKPGKYKSKVLVLCQEFGTKKYLPEHVEISFNNDAERKQFATVFSKFEDAK